MLQRPDKMNSPVLEDTTAKRIAVSWPKVQPVNAGDLEVISYKLFWNNQPGLINGMSEEELKSRSLYRFIVTAKNECGKTDGEDAPLESLHVGEKYCKVSVSWAGPEDGDVKKFRLEVKAKDGSYK